MRSHIKIGRIFGIEIGLHYSWFVIAVLIALSLGPYFHHTQPHWSEAAVWAAAIVTAVLFFVCLLLHELAHSLVAKSHHLRVREITLFALGGVSQIESEAPNATTEFWIAIVGPLTSAVIGFICWGLAYVAGMGKGPNGVTPAAAVLLWLGYINIALAVFNMIPGFPLDGGRVLRAIIWWIDKSPQRSTRAAARVGQVVAILFILFGIFWFFAARNFGGLWIALIGWFLLEAAKSSSVQADVMAHLQGHKVGDMMERNCGTVPGHLTVREFVDEILVHSGTPCFYVAQDGHIAGLLTPADLKRVSRDEWERTSVQSVMIPLSRVKAVSPETPAVEAIEMMGRENLTELAVVDDGKLEGIFSRGQVLRFLQIYSGLKQKAA
ncbi:MAG TPA: site-2 protease family protein [Candidatus Acidoferrales bacterium]|nr:site-2 protease family protein [Candidatus Acidoferrales bacterium]